MFKALVEKQSGKSIKCLQADNGCEYVNNRFNDYCATEGTQLQHTVPYCPQQNGVTERKNRTLKEMANCMIHSRGLGPQCWDEAINCANYVQNQTPHKAFQRVTLEEVWCGHKPSIGHLRVFECNA